MRESFWNMLGDKKIVIPKVQRDYAQGRSDKKITAIRNQLLKSLRDALDTGECLELDFIYGYEEDNAFYPLDGQQRLTTLFLLHWYIAAKERVFDDDIKARLAKFTYETRHSSRVFCEWLAGEFHPEIDPEKSVAEIIENQPRFFIAWKNDPTIRSMLTMLDAIQKEIDELEREDIWQLLVSDSPPVVFNLLRMTELGLQDELYIKMNSRGKPLTDFEYFKCRFAELLQDEDRKKEFSEKIDMEWYDLFWSLEAIQGDVATKADEAVLRYFRFIADILAALKLIDIQNDDDDLEKFKQVFSSNDNIAFLFESLDRLVEIHRDDWLFFTEMFRVDKDTDNENGLSVRLFFSKTQPNLFKKCANEYDFDKSKQNPFSLAEQLMLYACLLHLRNPVEDFHSKARILRNLLERTEIRSDRFSACARSVQILLYDGIELLISKSEGDNGFLSEAIKEEHKKHLFCLRHPDDYGTFCRMEDNALLRGCLAIFESISEDGDYADAVTFVDVFCELFDEGMAESKYRKINRALLTLGDYTQTMGKTKRFAVNDKIWRETFIPSRVRKGFDETRNVLRAFFDKLNTSDDIALDSIINEYLTEFESDVSKEKDWRYYYIKYDAFRILGDGFYSWNDESQYKCIEMEKKNLNGQSWNPFLLTLHRSHLHRTKLFGYYNSHYSVNPLKFVDGADILLDIRCGGDGFLLNSLHENGTALLEEALQLNWLEKIGASYLCRISQSDKGVDLEDRIDKATKLLRFFEELRTMDLN